MPADQSIPVAETAHRLEDIEVRILQIGEIRENVVPDQILQIKMVGSLPPLMVAIRDGVEMLALPLNQIAVFLIHFRVRRFRVSDMRIPPDASRYERRLEAAAMSLFVAIEVRLRNHVSGPFPGLAQNSSDVLAENPKHKQL
jgi:hypothetical protein